MKITPENFNEGFKMEFSILMGNRNYIGFRMIITCSKAMNNFKDTKANCQNSFKRVLKS